MTINNENDTFTEGQEVWIKGKIETHFGKFRKEDITKERVEKIIERLNQLRNHD